MDEDQLRGKAFADGTVEVLINNTSLGTADAGSFYANKGGQIGRRFRGRQRDNDEDDDRDRDRSVQAGDMMMKVMILPSGRPALLDDFGGGRSSERLCPT